jgi:hypothetical protein
MNESRVNPYPPAVENDEINLKEAIRRLSSITGDAVSVYEFDYLDESDLRRDYQTAIDCLIQCESMIKNLQEQLLSKEERIVSLEDKILHMSLELASSMAREDHLQHKMKTSFTTSTKSFTTTTSFETGSTSPPLDNSYSSGLSKNFGQLLSGIRNSIVVRNGPTLVEEAQEKPTTDPIEIDEKTASGDEACRTSKLGVFVRNNSIRKERRVDEMQTPDAMEEEEGQRNQLPFGGNRRRPVRSRVESRQSSRSFLEATGVVFPSTSFEVFSKGCLTKSMDKALCNEGWPEFG